MTAPDDPEPVGVARAWVEIVVAVVLLAVVAGGLAWLARRAGGG